MAGTLASGIASAAFPKVRLEPVSEGEIVAPVAIAHAGDGTGRLFVLDQRGTVRIIGGGGTLLPDPFLDISAKLVPERNGFDERGLLGIAFHPHYGTVEAPGSGKFYVYYSAPSPNETPDGDPNPVNHMAVVAEYSVSAADPNLADPLSERILLTVDEPQFNHNAGQLNFGPDGMLYIALGDGGSSDDNNAGHTGGDGSQPDGALGNAQDRSKLLGKILRVDPLGSDGPGGGYGIPADNPFVGEEGVRPEIYAFGLRNPWRFSFDRGTGRLFCADVGQRDYEEINLITSGGNYGWRNKEGAFDFDPTAPGAGPFIDPIAQYAHPNTTAGGLPRIGISVTGGYVYRGAEIPDLAGKYIFADWSTSFGSPNGTLLGLEESAGGGSWALSLLEVEGGNPVGRFINALGEGEDGELYVATKRTLAPSALDPDTSQPTGAIFKIIPATVELPLESAEIAPLKDSTIFSESNSVSNGAGSYLFAGQTNQGQTRRALIAFDIAAALPAGANVQSATLTMRMNKTPSGNETVSLHRLTSDWGEGASNASGEEGAGANAQSGDATWRFNFFNTNSWTALGGDFAAGPSASATVGSLTGSYAWSSPQLAGDVQAMLDNPAQNFGWIVIGDEGPGASAKRFDSRTAAQTANRPKLTVEYLGQPLGHREAWLAEHFDPEDEIDYGSDLDLDNLSLLFEYGAHLDPNAPNPTGDAYTIGTAAGEGGECLQVVFRRDPRATELIYRVEASDDAVRWEVIGESALGALATGEGVVSDHPLVDPIPLREVTVKDSVVIGGGEPARFIRFAVILVEG
ncbi:MAG: PQQ-dependent sugar dehydrogenase [Verrucomicrobiales bacterium]